MNSQLRELAPTINHPLTEQELRRRFYTFLLAVNKNEFQYPGVDMRKTLFDYFTANHRVEKLFVIGPKRVNVGYWSRFYGTLGHRLHRHNAIPAKFIAENLKKINEQPSVTLITEKQLEDSVVRLSVMSSKRTQTLHQNTICLRAPVIFQVRHHQTIVQNTSITANPNDLELTNIRVLKAQDQHMFWQRRNNDENIPTIKTSEFQGRYSKHTNKLVDHRRLILPNLLLGVLTAGLAHAIFYIGCLIHRVATKTWLFEKDPISFFERIAYQSRCHAKDIARAREKKEARFARPI